MITSTHDKLAHFLVFMIESWLFIKCFVHRKVQLRGTALSWIRDNFTTFMSVTEPQEIDLEASNGTNTNTNNNGIQGISLDKYVLGLIICTLFVAIGSEFMQSIVTGGKRSFDTGDIVCNSLGSLLGISLAYIVETKYS